jgi:hypothetical protein
MSAVTQRVRQHRSRMRDGALRRLEVVVPVQDADRMKRVAHTLRQNDARASRLRRDIDAQTNSESEATGASLFHFLGDPLFEDFELELPEREVETGRPVDLSEE